MWWWGICSGVSCSTDNSVNLQRLEHFYSDIELLTILTDSAPSKAFNRSTKVSNTVDTTHSTPNAPNYAWPYPLSNSEVIFYRARCRKTQELVAIKIFPARLLRKAKFRRRIRKEIRMLCSCRDHPNLMKLFHVHKWSGNMIIVFELAVGGYILQQRQLYASLFRVRSRAASNPMIMQRSQRESALPSRHSIGNEQPSIRSHMLQTGMLQLSSHFTEREVSRIIGSVVLALKYMHKKKLFHGNIRPHHILYSTAEPNARIVLTNFGSAGSWSDFSCVLQNGEFIWDDPLNLQFLPPFLFHPTFQEAVRKKPKRKHLTSFHQALQIDVWALGVTMYVLLYGAFPFEGSTKEATWRNIMHAHLSFPYRCSVGRAAKDLLLHLFEKRAEQAVTMQQISQHPWIKDNVSSTCVWSYHEIQQHCKFAEQYNARIQRQHVKVSDDIGSVNQRTRILTGNSEKTWNRFSMSEQRSSYVSVDGNPLETEIPLSTEGYMRQASEELENLLDHRCSQHEDDRENELAQERSKLSLLRRQYLSFIGPIKAPQPT